MCGRFALFAPAELLVRQFRLVEPSELEARYNIAPGQDLAVVVEGKGHDRHVRPMRWGLVPHWAESPKLPYSTINARAESVADKPAFRLPFRRRRCIVPASGWFEWQATPAGKAPWFIHGARGHALLGFAGLWDRWERGDERLDSCTIIVTRASARLATIHERMPVVLDPTDYDLWLSHDAHDADALQALLQPAPEARLAAYRVATVVNSPAHQGRECIEPLAERQP